jgi:NAD(P)-dependent dehydrogenase (short-subunit alcohol dehydrogenase family)
MSDHQIASGALFAPTFSLQGRTALVTGASRGIGWAAAALLHRRGARVALVGRSIAQLEQLAQAGSIPRWRRKTLPTWHCSRD